MPNRDGSLRTHTVGTPEEGRWQGWVRFPSLMSAARAARWAVGLDTTKKQARSRAGHVRQQLNARPGQPAGSHAGDIPAGVCHSFARRGHCRWGEDCRHTYSHTTAQSDFEFMDADPGRIKDAWAKKQSEMAQVIVDGECKTVTVVNVDRNEMTARLESGSVRALDLDQLIQDTADHYAPREEEK